MSTSQKIINLLNRKESTINELANRMGISRNSVHVQIGKLEAAGMVTKFHRELPLGAGKPAYFYRTVAGYEDSFSSAYKPLLTALMQTISADLPEPERIKLLEKTGRSIAKSVGLAPSNNLQADMQLSVDAANALGAMAEMVLHKNKPYVSCHSCPVATLVHSDPLVCRLIAAFFAEATGQSVAVDCRYKDTVVCGFSFEKT